MPNLDLLKDVIRDSGMTMVAISEKSGIVRETLYNRLNGKGDFTVSEVTGLCYALSISKPDRERIFFAK